MKKTLFTYISDKERNSKFICYSQYRNAISFFKVTTKRIANLSGCITPLWPGECWAFVCPVTKYADLVLVLASCNKTQVTSSRPAAGQRLGKNTRPRFKSAKQSAANMKTTVFKNAKILNTALYNQPPVTNKPTASVTFSDYVRWT